MYPAAHTLFHGIGFAEHFDELHHRVFAIGVAQGVHTALHFNFSAIDGYSLYAIGIVSGSLRKYSHKHALPNELEQDVHLVEFNPHTQIDVSCLPYPVEGIVSTNFPKAVQDINDLVQAFLRQPNSASS